MCRLSKHSMRCLMAAAMDSYRSRHCTYNADDAHMVVLIMCAVCWARYTLRINMNVNKLDEKIDSTMRI